MTVARMNPGTPDHRSAGRYLWWLIVSQRRRVAVGALLGSAWMIGLALPPYLLSRAIDDGLAPGRWSALVGWAMTLLGVGLVNAWLAIMRHRTMTRVRLDAAFRSVQVIVIQATRLGGALPRQATAGEMVTIGFGDAAMIANTLTITGPGVGAVLAYLMVAVLLLTVSPLLALVVLLGVPLLMVSVGPLLGRLQGFEADYREQQGALAARFGDIVGGLRVLNGIGGKAVFAERYRRRSRQLQQEGYRVGAVTSWVQALGVGLPTLFLGAVTWLAARMAVEGTITIGELVAVYGYTAVLAVPVAFFIQGGYDLSRGLVAARRVIRFLALEPDSTSLEAPCDAPDAPSPLHDPASGVEVAPGKLTVLVSARPAESAAVVDRLGRFAQSAATWGAIRLDEIDLAQVRDRVLVAENEADLFAGTLRDLVSGRLERAEEAIERAVHTAMAQDIVRALPDGLDSAVDAQGRNLSGGQRQRIRLVRALLADPEILLAIEPTSAVDTHTEAAIATRLHTARSGRTTVITSTSPLLLDLADTVYYLVDGSTAAVGSHRELLQDQEGYRLLVSRGLANGDEAEPVGAVEPMSGAEPVGAADEHNGNAEEAVR
ncbi:ABC transporter transmembrane domain-containing protein [Streptomyces albipurpureus]|uniref:ABC transporter ATP-binding protein/permease n=1 Tax=Streptomyces albipurpureus TaxID=2897419 RepID=A0ABT0UFF7_9ACTN|nr:ABC transporter ATP-binding protein [Streptomyces sp. CWNU-1]MCM2387349.1 ABC transporter ATP-binding protein/permease [Streptomyces sp. CWNU-1]